MDSLQLIRTFQEVAKRGSFSAAATALGTSRANASKYVAELERRLGVRLLNRSTRSSSLTDAGALLLERSQPLLELVDNTRADLSLRASQPRGRLRISSVASLSDPLFMDALSAFAKACPEVHLSCEFTNRTVDLVDEAVDLVLRVGRLTNSDLIAKKLLPVPFATVASPGFWQARGIPSTPAELGALPALIYTQNNSARSGEAQWWFAQAPGSSTLKGVQVQGRFDATDGRALAHMARAGLGVAHLPRAIVESDLANGSLQSVLDDWQPTDTWLVAAYAQRQHNSAALQALVAHLQQWFSGSPSGSSQPNI